MANIITEFRRKNPGRVNRTENVQFDTPYQTSPQITYNDETGEFTFKKPGVYSVKWWVATETAPKGTIEFTLVSPRVSTPGCSPKKTGQVIGYAAIHIKTAGEILCLKNTMDTHAVFSNTANIKAHILITQIGSMYTDGLIKVEHANLSTIGSFHELTVGNVIYRIQYLSSTLLSMFVKSTGETILVDIKRSSQPNSAVNGQHLDNYNLTTTSQSMDGTIYNDSNEMHRTWIRQKDPVTGLWSLHEVQLFSSFGGARVSFCVYLIYENIDLSAL